MVIGPAQGSALHPTPGGPRLTGRLWSCPSPSCRFQPLSNACLGGSRGLDPRTPLVWVQHTSPQLPEEGPREHAPPVLVGWAETLARRLAGCDAPTEHQGLCSSKLRASGVTRRYCSDYIHCDLCGFPSVTCLSVYRTLSSFFPVR